MRMKRFLSAASLALAIALFATDYHALAWQFDVHYLLTFWLATQAGFSRRDATEIATADQGYDDSNHHAAIAIVCYIATSGDTGAARDLQLKHFPSDAPVPSPP